MEEIITQELFNKSLQKQLAAISNYGHFQFSIYWQAYYKERIKKEIELDLQQNPNNALVKNYQKMFKSIWYFLKKSRKDKNKLVFYATLLDVNYQQYLKDKKLIEESKSKGM